MLVAFTTFVVAVAAVSTASSDLPQHIGTNVSSASTNATAEIWDADQICRWAAEASDAAAVLESERKALACELGCKNHAARARVGLLQAVLADLASDRRDESAAEALELHYRLVALSRQLELLNESEEILESLVVLSTRAEELDLPADDIIDLRQQRLEVLSELVAVRFGARKLQRRLASLIDRPLAEVEQATLSESWLSGDVVLDVPLAICTALANRGDYQAACKLCRQMTDDSMTAATTLMGVLNPGVGLEAAAQPTSILTRLCTDHTTASELQCRRRQCQTIREKIRQSIVDEVTVAVLGVIEETERLEISDDIQQLAEEQTERQRSATKIDQAPAGSQQRARLAELKRRSEYVDRQRDRALADTQLRRVMGTLATH